MSEPMRHSASDRAPDGGDATLCELAARLRGRGDADCDGIADALEATALRMTADGDALKRRLIESLAVNHDINNALVGVFGNAQLLALGPAAAIPGVKERLDVIQREAKRIKDAALRLSDIKHTLLVEGGSHGGPA